MPGLLHAVEQLLILGGIALVAVVGSLVLTLLTIGRKR